MSVLAGLTPDKVFKYFEEISAVPRGSGHREKIADYCENGSRFKEYAHKQLDFLLGVNATGYSMVTGAGEFCINYPHLRPAYADGIEKCMPGFVSGGPNSHRQDADARRLIPEGTPPMKCFIDEVGSYSINEITIYWNSPLVFMLGYLN